MARLILIYLQNTELNSGKYDALYYRKGINSKQVFLWVKHAFLIRRGMGLSFDVIDCPVCSILCDSIYKIMMFCFCFVFYFRM